MKADIRPPALIAHRGLPLKYPENTLVGIEAAARLGARYLEVDVQLTADGVPVLYHDEDMQRISGIDQVMAETPHAELARYSAYQPEVFGEAWINTPIPDLEEFCVLAQQFRGIQFFVELKKQSIQRFGAEQVVSAVLAHTQSLGESCIIISFEDQALRLVRENSQHRIGWILSEYSENSRVTANELAPEFLFCKIVRLPEGDETFWAGDWQWAIYETGEPDVALALAARGADLIETNSLEAMLADARLSEHDGH